jgi:hypothetical protein
MAQTSLHAITKVYYESYARLSYGSTQYHSIATVFWVVTVARPLLHRVSLGE